MTKAITDTFKLALAQLNPVLGDIEGNLNKARAIRARASLPSPSSSSPAIRPRISC
jgi:hypothetical protein